MAMAMAMAEQANMDRLSDLPTHLIHYIFDFLDASYAVQASVLSKRWRHVWRTLPFLRFSSYDSPLHSTFSFVNFVYKVLSLRSPFAKITTFAIQSQDAAIAPHLHSWLLVSIRHDHLTNLEIEIPLGFMNQFIHLPISLLTSKSLVDMHLNFGSQLTLPSFIEFPNLNYLSLHYTSLVDYMGTSTVVLSCPSLESLSIEDGGVNPLKNLVIDAPKLEEFYITKLSCEDVLDESAEIKVLAPNLIYFECENCMSRKFSFNDLSCLDHACFGLMTNYYGDQFNAMKNINARRMIEAVSPHIKYLTLNEELAIEAFFGSPYVLENASMQFCNLKHLDLTVYLYRNSIIAIMHLLKLSPGVETLYLDVTNEQVMPYPSPLEMFWHTDQDPANMPKCDNLCISEESLLQHLRLVEIEGAMGSESELKLMEFVLKNAAVLEKVSICCSNNAKPHMLVNFNKKLNGIPRASSPQISVPFPCHGRALL